MHRRLLAPGFAIAAAVLWLTQSSGTTAVRSQGSASPPGPRTAEEFDKMFKDLSNWGRWGKDDELGAVNLVTAAKTRQAAGLVKSGISLSLAHNPITEGGLPDIQTPSLEHIVRAPSFRSDTYRFDYHGYASSHIDALCHWQYKGMFYNDIPTPATAKGCVKLGIENLKNGVVTRGILIDLTRLKGVPYLEPGTPIYVEDVEAWEKKAGVKVSAGDALLLYTGRWARRAKLGPWPLPNGPHAGFHVSVAPWIKRRDIAIVGGDVDTDMRPSPVEGVSDPMHTVLIVSLGINILDAFDLELLAETAAKLNRWEFMLTLAPIPVTGGTGGPLNALATF